MFKRPGTAHSRKSGRSWQEDEEEKLLKKKQEQELKKEKAAWRKERKELIKKCHALVRWWRLQSEDRGGSAMTFEEMKEIQVLKKNIAAAAALGVNIEKVAMHPMEIHRIAKALRDHEPNATLYLNNGMLRNEVYCADRNDAPEGWVHGIYRIAQELAKPELSLQTLYINRNSIGKHIHWVGQAMKTNIRLRRLCINGNGCGEAGLYSLVEGLSCNRTLEQLCMNENDVGDEGMQYLIDLLNNNETGRLTMLWLSGNGITDVGMVALSKALVANTTLVTLGLEDNDITDAGARSLCNVLVHHNATLQKVELNDNPDIAPHWLGAIQRFCEINSTYYGIGCWSLRRRRELKRPVPEELHRRVVVFMLLGKVCPIVREVPAHVRQGPIVDRMWQLSIKAQKETTLAEADAAGMEAFFKANEGKTSPILSKEDEAAMGAFLQAHSESPDHLVDPPQLTDEVPSWLQKQIRRDEGEMSSTSEED